MFKVRASQLSKLLSEPKSKADKDAGLLSETAKTMVKEQLLFDLWGYKSEFSNKYIRKGLMLEGEAIAALSQLHNDFYTKNEERRENDWVSGECDIVTAQAIRDVKCSWSLDTFPLTEAEALAAAKKAGYDMQGQVYMWLWNKPAHYVDYVLLPTPRQMLGAGDNVEMHIDVVDDIPLGQRVTSVKFERDEALHEKIKAKVDAARAYYDLLLAEVQGKDARYKVTVGVVQV